MKTTKKNWKKNPKQVVIGKGEWWIDVIHVKEESFIVFTKKKETDTIQIRRAKFIDQSLAEGDYVWRFENLKGTRTIQDSVNAIANHFVNKENLELLKQQEQ